MHKLTQIRLSIDAFIKLDEYCERIIDKSIIDEVKHYEPVYSALEIIYGDEHYRDICKQTGLFISKRNNNFYLIFS